MKASARRTDKQKLTKLRKTLRVIVAYPTEKHGRRTDDGYPAEFMYDEFSYRRMVKSFRDAITAAINESMGSI